jgi:CHAT domain-containing protein/tetratricopeptide (TPR) repeat protein
MARARKAAASVKRRRRTAAADDGFERAVREGYRAFDEKNARLARFHFRHAITYVRQSGRRRERLPELLGMCGRSLQRDGGWEVALELYAKAASEARAQGLAAQQLRWSGKLGTGHLDMKDPARGIPLLERSIELGRRLYRKKVPGVVEELGRQMTRLAFEIQDDRPRQAATFLEEALELGREAVIDRVQTVETLNLLGAVCRRMKAFERGGDTLMAAAARIDDDLRTEVMNAALNAYFEGRLWEKMQAVARDLLRRFEQDRDPRAADMGGRYAIACRELGHLDEAASALAGAVALAEADPSLQQKLRAELARVVFEQGRTDRAVTMFETLWNEGLRDRLNAMRYPQALLSAGRIADAKAVCAQYVADDGDEADVAIPLARIAEAEGRSAIEPWQNAARQSKGSERALALERLLELLPDRDPERLKVAEALARIAETVRQDVADLFSEHAWRAASPIAPRFNRYLDTFLSEAVAVERHEDAVYELERFRSQLLVDILSERANAWAGERRTLGEKSSYADRAHRAEYRYQALSAMDAGWASRREAARAADEAGSLAFSAGGVMLMGPEIIGMQFPEDLSAHLKDVNLAADETLVFLRITPKGTLLWQRGADGRIDHDAVPEFTLDIAQRLDVALRKEPDLTATLAALDRSLASPLAAALAKGGARRAFVAGGTDLANLPLDHCDSLVRSDMEIGFLPTARALGFARAARFPRPEALFLPTARDRRRFARELLKERGAKALVVLDPTRSLRFAELEGLSVAAAAARRLKVDIVRRADATREKVQGLVGGYGHLHLISHGRFDSANPYRTGMYMDQARSANSLWTVADVFGDAAAAPAGRLAVLSGCETGTLRGNVVSEEISLPAAFLACGFAAVVASRWAVDDLSAALFVTEFYRAWLRGRTTVAAALRGASQWLRALSKTDAGDYLSGVEAEVREVHPDLGPRMARLVRAARSDLAKRRALPFSNPRQWTAFYVVGDAAQMRRTT